MHTSLIFLFVSCSLMGQTLSDNSVDLRKSDVGARKVECNRLDEQPNQYACSFSVAGEKFVGGKSLSTEVFGLAAVDGATSVLSDRSMRSLIIWRGEKAILQESDNSIPLISSLMCVGSVAGKD